MKIRKELCWDCQFDKIQLDEHSDIIIQRTVDFGTWEEFEKAVEYYGEESFIDSLMNNTELSERGVYFASHYFGKKLTDFKCYIRRQSIPIHFSF